MMTSALEDVPVDVPSELVGQQPERIQLSDEQRQVLDMVKNGKSVFFTGSAGCGKSVLLREIISYLRSTAVKRGWDDHSIAVTALTGIAAINIGGSTLHSWAGINMGKEPLKRLVEKLWGKHKSPRKTPPVGLVNDIKKPEPWYNAEEKPEYFTAIERWRLTRVLIIDEGKVSQY